MSILPNFNVYLNNSGRQMCNCVRYFFRNLKQVLGLFCVVVYCSSLLSYYSLSSVYANRGIHYVTCVISPGIVNAFRILPVPHPLILFRLEIEADASREEGNTIWHARLTLCHTTNSQGSSRSRHYGAQQNHSLSATFPPHRARQGNDRFRAC